MLLLYFVATNVLPSWYTSLYVVVILLPSSKNGSNLRVVATPRISEE